MKNNLQSQNLTCSKQQIIKPLDVQDFDMLPGN